MTYFYISLIRFDDYRKNIIETRSYIKIPLPSLGGFLYYYCGKTNLKKRMTKNLVERFFVYRRKLAGIYPTPIHSPSDIEFLSYLNKNYEGCRYKLEEAKNYEL